MKATTKTTTATATPVAVPAKTIAALKASIATLVNADKAVTVAVTSSQQTILLTAQAVKEAKLGDRPTAREVLNPLFVEAFAKVGKDEAYAKQQASRVLSLAYPGGLKADTKAAAKAQAQIDKAIANKLGTNDVLRVATGGAVVHVDPKTKAVSVVSVRKGGSGGHNAKTPLESFTFDAGNVLTAANTAKIDLEQIANVTVSALVALDYSVEDIAKAFAKATKP